jgi:hypothetical protein
MNCLWNVSERREFLTMSSAEFFKRSAWISQRNCHRIPSHLHTGAHRGPTEACVLAADLLVSAYDENCAGP